MDTMKGAEAEPDPAAADPLIIETLSVCATAQEWLDALREHPGAMGLTESAAIGTLDLQATCYGHETTPVCRDAAAQGLLSS